MKLFLAGFAAYIIGHSATNTKECNDLRFTSETECRAANGMMSGMFWPLYWTWTGFAALEREEGK